jgi:molybdate transport system permease protein
MATDWFPLWLSLRVAAVATLLSLAAGLWAGWWLAKPPFRGRTLLHSAVNLPLVLPPTVLGYYLLVLLGQNSPIGRFYEWIFGAPLLFTWQAAVVAAFLYSAPLVAQSVRLALESLDPQLERAARSLGASGWSVFARVTLPLTWRPVLAAAVLAFARSLGEFGVTLMIAGNLPGRTQTLAVAVYDATERGQGAAARMLVLVISAAALAALWAAGRLSARQAV